MPYPLIIFEILLIVVFNEFENSFIFYLKCLENMAVAFFKKSFSSSFSFNSFFKVIIVFCHDTYIFLLNILNVYEWKVPTKKV